MKRFAIRLGVAACLLQVFTSACASQRARPKDEDKQWTMQNKNYASTRYSTLEFDYHRQRQESQGRVDVLDRRAARARRRTAGDRQHHVRPHAVPEHRLRPGPDQGRRADQVEVHAEAESAGHSGRVLRHGESRPGLCRRHDLPESAGHHDGRARRRDRQGSVEGQAGRLHERSDHHLRAARDQGQGDLRHQRRRVRRARLRHRQRREDRQADLAHVQHRAGRRSRLPRIGGDLEGRRVEDRRRHHVGLVQLRPRAQPALLRHRQSRDRGIPTSGLATTSGR